VHSMLPCWILYVDGARCRRNGPPWELPILAPSGTLIYMDRFPQGLLTRDPSSPW